MQRLQRQMNRDSRWDSAIDRLEIKYGLHLDDWKRLGRDQMGQKCGRGWYGLRGACKRGKKGADNSAAIKASKLALADKIRKRKGLTDRNAPKSVAKVEKPRGSRITKDDVNAEPWKFTAEQYQVAHGVKQPWIAEIAPARMAEQSKSEKSRYFKERAKEWDASAAIKAEWGGKVWDAYKKGKITDADIQDDSGNRGTFGDLSAKRLVYSRKNSEKKASFDADFLKAREINSLKTLDDIDVGSRVFDIIQRKYLEVTKKFKTKVMAIDEEGVDHSVQTGRLQWKSNDDLISAVKNGESPKPEKAQSQQSKASEFRKSQQLKEGSKVVAGGLTRKELDDFSFESVGRRSVGQLSELPNGQVVTFRGQGRSRRSSGIPDGDYFQITKTTKSGSTYGIPLDKSGKAISDKPIRLKNDPAKWLEVADVDEDQKKYGTFGSVEELNTKYGRSDSDDSPHFDSSEIVRYTRVIASLNDRYGWHIDAQKVLSKLGKKLGKKCGKGWISPEKKCKSHYTNGKLNEAGKSSGENLADRIRQRKKLSTVSRDGKGKELAYAFLPGNQKQSTMAARRTHAPRSGYETPGRLSKTNSTEERRSMVGLGRNPGTRSKPDDAPIMDLPTRPNAKKQQSDTPKILKDISPATAINRSEFLAYLQPESLAKIEDRAIIENWQNSSRKWHLDPLPSQRRPHAIK